RQLDHRAARKTLAFRATQAKRDVDRPVLHLARLLAHVALWRARVEDLDFDLAGGLFLQALRPWLGHVALEEALRTEEVAELERDRLRRGARCDEDESCEERQAQGRHRFLLVAGGFILASSRRG